MADAITGGCRRLPAEWEPHQGTWMSWPNRRGDSFHGEVLGRVVPTFLEIVRALAGSETVFLNVSDEDEAALVAREIAGGVVELYQIPTNEPWCRDHGPVIVDAAGERLATCWGFNGWGGKYQPFGLDAAAAPKMADALAIKTTELPLVLEGGMIDSNGAGAALVARKALLDPRRNPGLTQGRAEEVLRREMGIERVLWLDEQVPGDDTDGHVDVYARFVSEDQIIACHDQEAVARIRSALPGFEILPLDPPPALEIEGQRLPAGYANFYIANRCVLLPVFGTPQDDAAAALLRQCFPGRDIIPIDCRELAWGLGSIHCLTQQLPVPAKGDSL